MKLGPNIHLIPKIGGANTYAVLGETHVGGGRHLTLIDTVAATQKANCCSTKTNCSEGFARTTAARISHK
jgi:hypothetical protein